MLVAALLTGVSAQSLAPALPAPAPLGSAARGEQLFAGAVPLRNRGPACAACHRAAGLPFPGGGTLGPDLSGAYTKLGPAGLEVALRTLFFPAMVPLYRAHPLTAAERADLTAFFAAAARQPPQPTRTAPMAGIAIVGCLVLFALTGFAGRERLRGVRARMVAAARQRPSRERGAR